MCGSHPKTRDPKTQPIRMFNASQLPVKRAISQHFAVFNKMFTSVPGPSWPNHQFAQSATSCGTSSNVMYVPHFSMSLCHCVLFHYVIMSLFQYFIGKKELLLRYMIYITYSFTYCCCIHLTLHLLVTMYHIYIYKPIYIIYTTHSLQVQQVWGEVGAVSPDDHL